VSGDDVYVWLPGEKTKRRVPFPSNVFVWFSFIFSESIICEAAMSSFLKSILLTAVMQQPWIED
jgi:hypothetical protein